MDRSLSEIDVVVVGAGPAGLAVSSCLGRAGVSYLLLERENSIAPAWRRHYNRLHLHTSRAFSSLPHYPMPRSYPRYPSRNQVADYLDGYRRAEGIEPQLGVEVLQLRRESSSWEVKTDNGLLRSKAVVLASGTNGEPNRPKWPGLETFSGPVVHSAEYRDGSEFSSQNVLVVGLGNSGGEIALDLVEHGARPAISVRSPLNVIPRDILGIPVLAIAIPLTRLPSRIADLLIWPILKAYYPSYRQLGLRKAAMGPLRQIAQTNRIPLLDIGTVREIRRGRIDIVQEIAEVVGSTVHFTRGEPRDFDAIVLATGYRLSVPSGAESIPAGGDVGGESGLYFCGFYVSPTGMLRQIGIEAKEIVGRILARFEEAGSA